MCVVPFRRNQYYDKRRSTNAIGPVKVHFVSGSAFTGVRSELIAQRTNPSQLKLPRVMRHPAVIDLLMKDSV